MTAKLYHQNGCTQCEATVLDCRANADGTFDILLDRTAIYPEGGGQLSDTGYIGPARLHPCARRRRRNMAPVR